MTKKIVNRLLVTTVLGVALSGGGFLAMSLGMRSYYPEVVVTNRSSTPVLFDSGEFGQSLVPIPAHSQVVAQSASHFRVGDSVRFL